jgi:hypothetical protein
MSWFQTLFILPYVIGHLLIYPEEGGSKFLENFSIHLPEYTASHSRGSNFQIMGTQMPMSTGSKQMQKGSTGTRDFFATTCHAEDTPRLGVV